MKKIIFALIMILCAGFFSACSGKTDADVGTVFIEKKGSIVSVDVEELDKDYYDAKELEDYIAKHVEDYTNENGGTVKQVSFSTDEGTAKLKMKYDSYQDYASFNGIEFYVGTVVGARAQGYDFDTEFYRASEASEEGKGAEPASKEEVLSDDDNKTAIIKANVNVRVPGRILYVSAQDTKIIDSDTVSITGKGSDEEAALTYIIYQ